MSVVEKGELAGSSNRLSFHPPDLSKEEAATYLKESTQGALALKLTRKNSRGEKLVVDWSSKKALREKYDSHAPTRGPWKTRHLDRKLPKKGGGSEATIVRKIRWHEKKLRIQKKRAKHEHTVPFEHSAHTRSAKDLDTKMTDAPTASDTPLSSTPAVTATDSQPVRKIAQPRRRTASQIAQALSAHPQRPIPQATEASSAIGASLHPAHKRTAEEAVEDNSEASKPSPISKKMKVECDQQPEQSKALAPKPEASTKPAGTQVQQQAVEEPAGTSAEQQISTEPTQTQFLEEASTAPSTEPLTQTEGVLVDTFAPFIGPRNRPKNAKVYHKIQPLRVVQVRRAARSGTVESAIREAKALRVMEQKIAERRAKKEEKKRKIREERRVEEGCQSQLTQAEALDQCWEGVDPAIRAAVEASEAQRRASESDAGSDCSQDSMMSFPSSEPTSPTASETAEPSSVAEQPAAPSPTAAPPTQRTTRSTKRKAEQAVGESPEEPAKQRFRRDAPESQASEATGSQVPVNTQSTTQAAETPAAITSAPIAAPAVSGPASPFSGDEAPAPSIAPSERRSTRSSTRRSSAGANTHHHSAAADDADPSAQGAAGDVTHDGAVTESPFSACAPALAAAAPRRTSSATPAPVPARAPADPSTPTSAASTTTNTNNNPRTWLEPELEMLRSSDESFCPIDDWMDDLDSLPSDADIAALFNAQIEGRELTLEIAARDGKGVRRVKAGPRPVRSAEEVREVVEERGLMPRLTALREFAARKAEEDEEERKKKREKREQRDRERRRGTGAGRRKTKRG
ncbi:hypothetical protein SLS55_009981 [Diplodia seriata]|uniref:Uncharacterized protein n=1 Tax=Diplodia seriata TaxID=420778 RepID=A0ABR3C2Z0_9PEZI